MQIVPHLPNGCPVDIKWMSYYRLFDGEKFIVFDSAEEYNEYMSIHYPDVSIEILDNPQ